MKKIIIALVALFASTFSADAAYQYFLNVNKADGTAETFGFELMPVAQLEGDDVKFTMAMTGESVLIPVADIINMTFHKVGLGTEDIKSDLGGVVFVLGREAVEISGLAAGCEVSVYDATGALRLRGTADAGGSLSLPTVTLAKGAYIVSAGKNSFKFIR